MWEEKKESDDDETVFDNKNIITNPKLLYKFFVSWALQFDEKDNRCYCSLIELILWIIDSNNWFHNHDKN